MPKAALPPGLKIERIALSDLLEDDRNPRTHDTRNLDAIKASLSKFGQVEPLVVQMSTSRVIGGNGRLSAMRSLLWVDADCVRLDVDNHKADALAVALNRTAELAGWDYEVLADFFRNIAESDVTIQDVGWAAEEVSNILGSAWEPAAETDMDDMGPEEKRVVKFSEEQWDVVTRAVGKTDVAGKLTELAGRSNAA